LSFYDPVFRATSIIGWVLDAIFGQKTGRQGLNEGVAVPPPQIYLFWLPVKEVVGGGQSPLLDNLGWPKCFCLYREVADHKLCDVSTAKTKTKSGCPSCRCRLLWLDAGRHSLLEMPSLDNGPGTTKRKWANAGANNLLSSQIGGRFGSPKGGLLALPLITFLAPEHVQIPEGREGRSSAGQQEKV
jgi:hypothetical protein